MAAAVVADAAVVVVMAETAGRPLAGDCARGGQVALQQRRQRARLKAERQHSCGANRKHTPRCPPSDYCPAFIRISRRAQSTDEATKRGRAHVAPLNFHTLRADGQRELQGMYAR